MVSERGSRLPDRAAERRPRCTFSGSDISHCREHLNPSRTVIIGKLWPFALGSVALELDAYVIAGPLLAIAGSLKASGSNVGLGVAAFIGGYTITGPILVGRARQRSEQSLMITLAVFILANVGTAVVPSIMIFLAVRTIAGAATDVYSPLSSAVAVGIVEFGRQGRTLSLVLSGLVVGTVFGIPTGLIVAAR